MPTDPALASRLKEVIEQLESGARLDDALRGAGVSRGEAREFFASVKKSLGSPSSKKRTKTKKEKPWRPGAAIVAYSDGGSRGNPGLAACAAILYDADGDELVRRSRRLGKATNNVAEYEGVVLALELCGQLRASDVTLRVDSELIARQIQGTYKVKHASLKPYHERIGELASAFASFTVEHIPRAQNAEADKLVNAALDGKAED
jgi:ribonuclease HI